MIWGITPEGWIGDDANHSKSSHETGKHFCLLCMFDPEYPPCFRIPSRPAQVSR
jgi:hypothetical protein